jgi:hypothetical protein
MNSSNQGDPGLNFNMSYADSNRERLPDPASGYSPGERRLYAEAFECMRDTVFDLASMRRLFTILLQAHWSHTGNFLPHAKGLECLTYNPEAENGGPLIVRSEYDFDEQNSFTTPSIYVGVDRMNFQKMSVDSKIGDSDDLATTYRQWQTVSTLKVSHFNRSSDVVQRMADNTMFFLLGIRESLMHKFPIRAMDPVDSGQLMLVRKSPERCFRADAAVSITYSFDISTTIESHRLRQFIFEITPGV